MTQFNRNGFMVFSSYRDPNLAETFDVLNETADYVRTFNVSDREMDKFIIGTMSSVDAPLPPQGPVCHCVDWSEPAGALSLHP